MYDLLSRESCHITWYRHFWCWIWTSCLATHEVSGKAQQKGLASSCGPCVRLDMSSLVGRERFDSPKGDCTLVPRNNVEFQLATHYLVWNYEYAPDWCHLWFLFWYWWTFALGSETCTESADENECQCGCASSNCLAMQRLKLLPI
jgi:hypothetical protein